MRGLVFFGKAAGGGAALLATIVVAYGADPVVPVPNTGFDLKQRLGLLYTATDLTDRFVAVRAVGYVDGVADAAGRLGFVCYPTGVDDGQVREVVANYLRDHPERLHDPAGTLVLNSLFEAYACRRSADG